MNSRMIPGRIDILQGVLEFEVKEASWSKEAVPRIYIVLKKKES